MLLLILLLCLPFSPNVSPTEDFGEGEYACYYSPMVFPQSMPIAANIISDALSEELAVAANHKEFLGRGENLTRNNTTEGGGLDRLRLDSY